MCFIWYIKQKCRFLFAIANKTSIPFGQAQMPQLWDYADGVDTMEFLVFLYLS
jgi:hypothetical protein